MRALVALDQSLDGLTRAGVLGLAACGTIIVGGIDYVTGYEVSIGLLYLGPVALAAWYAGKWPGVGIAMISCVSWYIADVSAGDQYSHSAIPVWNALVRLGFFLITGLLLTALRDSFLTQRRLARTDYLTELYTRRAFEDRLEHDLALARRLKSPVTLVYVDLDNFKAVNDTHGHAEGDRVLQTTGRVLKNSVRLTDTAARLGGDEFALVLPETDGRGAQQVIANLARKLQEAFTASNFGVTSSIGVVTFLDADLTMGKAVAAADALMYKVKHKGKGTVAFSVLGSAGQPRVGAGPSQAARS